MADLNNIDLYNQKILENYSALLLDFDGTLLNSMPAHNQAWIETFKKYNVTITADELQSMAGIPNQNTAFILCQKWNVSENPVLIATLKESRAKELLEQSQLFPELEKVVSDFYKKLPLGIVSGSHRPLIIPFLRKFNLEKHFDCIISAEDTLLGKPNPDPFLEAAKRLNIPNEKCLVFEDGLLGIEAAQKANMKTVLVKEGHFNYASIPFSS